MCIRSRPRAKGSASLFGVYYPHRLTPGLVARATSLLLNHDCALFGLCHLVGGRGGLLFAVVGFCHPFAVVDMPLIVFLVDPDW
jgi:hypothetical protein